MNTPYPLRMTSLFLGIFFFLPLIALGSSTLTLVSLGNNPAAKIKSRTPFISYLVKNLKKDGVEKGKVLVVESLQEAASLLKNEEADLFVDSPYPAAVVSKLSGSQFLLRRWKKGVSEYFSVIFTKKEKGIKSLEDFKEKMLAFERPSSTSGYFLPKTLLLEKGLKLTPKKHFRDPVAPDEIGYLFSEGDETTMVWVLKNKVAGGATDFPSFQKKARGEIDQLAIIAQTQNVPRHIISYRYSLPPTLVKKIKIILLNMHNTEEGKKVLKGYSKTARFDEFPAQSLIYLENMKKYINLENLN